MASYALSLAFAWTMAPDMFATQPSYRAINDAFPHPRVCAFVLLVYCVISCTCLMAGSRPKKALLGVVGAMLWTTLGSSMLLSSIFLTKPYFPSPAGIFELLGAFGCLVSAMQWSDQFHLMAEEPLLTPEHSG